MAVATTHSSSTLDSVEIKHPIYPPAAFRFVIDGLAYTTDRAFGHGAGEDPRAAGGLPLPDMRPDTRHVSGQQLCLGLREYAIERYGMLAPCVMRHWNVVRTEDFGRIVYALIEAGRLTKSAEDSLEDFQAVFDFDEAFANGALSARLGRG